MIEFGLGISKGRTCAFLGFGLGSAVLLLRGLGRGTSPFALHGII